MVSMLYKNSARERVDTLEMKEMYAGVLKIAIRHYALTKSETLKGYIETIKTDYDSM